MHSTVKAAMPTVLVVDDSESSREVIRKKLDFLGVTDIHMANNGREGLAVLNAMVSAKAPVPDFVICDVYMPDIDGIEFIDVLVKRKFKGGLIVMTGVSQDMLEVAQHYASIKGLCVVGAFTKPLHHEPLGLAMGLAPV